MTQGRFNLNKLKTSPINLTLWSSPTIFIFHNEMEYFLEEYYSFLSPVLIQFQKYIVKNNTGA